MQRTILLEMKWEIITCACESSIRDCNASPIAAKSGVAIEIGEILPGIPDSKDFRQCILIS